MNKITEVWLHLKMRHLMFTSKKMIKVAYGGRGSGKSYAFAIGCIKYALENPGSKILCIRGTQNKISNSSLATLKTAAELLGAGHLVVETEHTLKTLNGSTFILEGAQNPQRFKSMHGINLCWVDEANELSYKAWEYLDSQIHNFYIY